MSKKILIVDDDPDLVKVFGLRLKGAGFEAVIASTAEEGLAKAESESPNLILLDIQMPTMSGTELAGKLSANEKTKSIPIIFMTGKVDLEKENLPQRPDVDVIIKPCNFDELVDKVNRLAK